MRYLTGVLAILLFTGCLSTSEFHVEEWEDESPYSIVFDGNEDDAAAEIRRMMIANGMDQVEETDGVLVFEKPLTRDERIELSALTSAFTGTQAGEQFGRLIFEMEQREDDTAVMMSGRISTEIVQRRTFQDRRQTESYDAFQGHPFLVMTAHELNQREGWQVLDPPIEQMSDRLDGSSR